MKSLFAIAISAAVLALPAQVNIVKSPLSLDADPNGPGWKTAAEQSDFKLLKASGKTNPAAQTSFKVAADADNLYLCIVCKEDKMDQLRKSKSPSSMWSTDSVEIFLAPSGQSDVPHRRLQHIAQGTRLVPAAYALEPFQVGEQL